MEKRDFSTTYDVIVVGAGCAGFGAAMGAARAGKKVLLLDGNSGPGGTAAFAGCPVFSPYVPRTERPFSGVFGEFVEALGSRCRTPQGRITVNTSEFDVTLIMTRMLARAGVDMLFYATLTAAAVTRGVIESITVFCCGGKLRFSAPCFVDATGDAVLTDLAGGETVTATAEEAMTRTVLFRVSGVENFDREKIKTLFPTLGFPYPHQDRFMAVPVGREGEDILVNLTAVSGNALDPFDRTRMDIELREQIEVIHRWMREKLPGFEMCRIAAAAPVMGVRASRFIVGRTVVSCRDLDENTPVPDPVAVGPRSYGDHFVSRFAGPWHKMNAGTRGIPYRALLPEKIRNLAACGRCISVDPKIATAVRYAPCCMATGQAAGIAAALGIPGYEALKKELVRQNAV